MRTPNYVKEHPQSFKVAAVGTVVLMGVVIFISNKFGLEGSDFRPSSSAEKLIGSTLVEVSCEEGSYPNIRDKGHGEPPSTGYVQFGCLRGVLATDVQNARILDSPEQSSPQIPANEVFNITYKLIDGSQPHIEPPIAQEIPDLSGQTPIVATVILNNIQSIKNVKRV